MSNKRRNRRTAKSARSGAMGKARARMKLAANVTEEQDWYLDTPDVRLSRIFTVVLLLHAIAIGGILAFKMVDKASANTGITITTAKTSYEDAAKQQKELAASVPTAPAEPAALQRPATPLRKDASNANQYKVQAGDKLPDIAKRHSVSPEALRSANSIISDNELYPGRWLNIPRPGEKPQTAAVATPVEAKPVVENQPAASSYTVKKGDTAWGISQDLGVSFGDLMKVNGIDRPESLQIGQVLKVPGQN